MIAGIVTTPSFTEEYTQEAQLCAGLFAWKKEEGSMSEGERSRFYRSGAWTNCRRSYLASVGGLCEECLSRGIITPAVIVHHKIPLTVENMSDESIALGWDNLEAVCRDCHAKIHGDERRWRVEPNGKIKII